MTTSQIASKVISDFNRKITENKKAIETLKKSNDPCAISKIDELEKENKELGKSINNYASELYFYW